jgi:hypothetical protein
MRWYHTVGFLGAFGASAGDIYRQPEWTINPRNVSRADSHDVFVCPEPLLDSLQADTTGVQVSLEVRARDGGLLAWSRIGEPDTMIALEAVGSGTIEDVLYRDTWGRVVERRELLLDNDSCVAGGTLVIPS